MSRERGAEAGEERPAGIYVHFPFCATRCSYCDFATVAGRDELVERYLAALRREIAAFQSEAPRSADSVYLGGGTPSRMTPGQVESILAALRARFELADACEITLEGNPESLGSERLEGYRAAGVTRICVGVQSLDDGVLARAGRPHDAAEAARAVGRARAAGFPAVALDLIAGLPGEDLGTWGETVRRAAGLEPDHVSAYLIEMDKDTPLSRAARAGRVRMADDDALGQAYERTVEALESEGFVLYEISNFARPGFESRHNLKYWSDEPFAAFGLGAHAYLAGARRANTRDLPTYLERLEAGCDPVEWRDPWDPDRRAAEALVLGLRRGGGVDVAALGRRYRIDLAGRHRDAFERAEAAGVLARDGDVARLTPFGRLRSNELFSELI